MNEVSEVDPTEETHPVPRFMQRIRYLITTDPDLNVAEAVGALHMLAHELATHGVFPEWFEDDG
jgi:hypothetical protein